MLRHYAADHIMFHMGQLNKALKLQDMAVHSSRAGLTHLSLGTLQCRVDIVLRASVSMLPERKQQRTLDRQPEPCCN